jgi:hypothetical protein
MIFSDGECPNCSHPKLCLNEDDLLECPGCRLVCANTDGVVASIMPFLGIGKFRFDDGKLPKISGIAFAKALPNSAIADVSTMFSTRAEIQDYLKQLPTPESATMEEAKSLWNDFCNAFAQEISSIPSSEFNAAWASSGKRTKFYAETVMPRIAKQLKLTAGKEEFHVDYVMSRLSRGERLVPKIYIESENSYDAADHEIRKLCSLNSPLRVLVTVWSRPESPRTEAELHKNLREWQDIVRAHAEVNTNFAGVIGIIIASQKNRGVLFRTCAFDSDGDLAASLLRLLTISTS